jgi:hypothetical protein
LGITNAKKEKGSRHQINISEHCFNTRDIAVFARISSASLALTLLTPFLDPRRPLHLLPLPILMAEKDPTARLRRAVKGELIVQRL